ncbi:hypothetical protein BN1708_008218 [Verticillium longisporum]|uniref:Uncharacterized protein n=1 Tax=Verticillium longisporum TaxID=100787 RepID=A0A0G4N256_VERLO|nr:hypothetical protein BN1708_008218 [Verticillium longisporum]
MVLKRKRSSEELSSSPSSFSSSPILPEHTLSMLYSAQQHSDTDFTPTSPSPMPRILERPAQPAPTAQRSLHAFWNINSAPAAPSFTPSASQTCHEASSCEDCGVGFGSRDGTDSMDINGYGFDSEDDHLCGACRRHVCSGCSVTNLGEQRRCLTCAGRRVRVGGLGWTTTRIPF